MGEPPGFELMGRVEMVVGVKRLFPDLYALMRAQGATESREVFV